MAHAVWICDKFKFSIAYKSTISYGPEYTRETKQKLLSPRSEIKLLITQITHIEFLVIPYNKQQTHNEQNKNKTEKKTCWKTRQSFVRYAQNYIINHITHIVI